MNQMLLEWAVTASLLILAVIVLRALLGRRVSAKLRYALWLVVLARLLIPVQLFPIFSAPLVTAPAFPEPPALSTAAPLPEQDAPAPVPSYALPEPTHLPDGTYITYDSVTAFTTQPGLAVPPSLGQILGGIWLAGALVMGLAFLLSNVRFARRLRRNRTLLKGADCFLCTYVADGLPSPCLFGLLHPAIYVTPAAAADEAMLRHVLAHEYTHFRHHDHIWNVLRSIALAVHWWNPLVWLAVVLSRRDCELACDEGALARLGEGERIAYGRTLVALLTEKPKAGDLFTCATTMTGGQKSVFDRVSRIARTPKRWLWAAVVVVIAAAAACVFAFGRAAAQESTLDPDPFGTPSVEVWMDLDSLPDYNPWPDSSETRPEYWPGVTLRWTQTAVSAVKDGQETVLYTASLIPNVYLTDLNDDGYPELCSALPDGNYTSIAVYDYENGVLYTLKGHDGSSYFLRLETADGTFRNALWAVEQSPDGAELRAGPLALTDAGLDIQTPYTLDPDPLDSLTFAPAVGDGSGDVAITGFPGGSYADWSLDTSPSQGQLYFAGSLDDFCALSGYTVEAGSALWTDESRTAVAVTMGVNPASAEPGSASEFMVHFTVNTNLGTVTGHGGTGQNGGLLTLSDGDMVDMARLMGRLLSAAEAYYYTQFPTLSIQIDPVFAMDGLNTHVVITGLDCQSALWYPARTNSYSGERVDPCLTLTAPEFLGEQFMEFYYSCEVRCSPEDSPTLVQLNLYTSNYTLSQYTVDLSTGTAEPMDDASGGPLTDRKWTAIARALAGLYVDAADYYAAASILPVEEGPLPFDTAMKLWFGSGAGAWNTILTLHPDGTFEGDYHDTDMGSGGADYSSVEYVCRFHGRFGAITQVTPASYSMTLEELVLDTGRPIGEAWIAPLDTYPAGSAYNVRYVSTGPYGMDDPDGEPLAPGAQFMLYTPDAQGHAPGTELYGMYADNPDWDSIMYQFWTWWPKHGGFADADNRLGCYALCNMEMGYGFFDLHAWGIT